MPTIWLLSELKNNVLPDLQTLLNPKELNEALEDHLKVHTTFCYCERLVLLEYGEPRGSSLKTKKSKVTIFVSNKASLLLGQNSSAMSRKKNKHLWHVSLKSTRRLHNSKKTRKRKFRRLCAHYRQSVDVLTFRTSIFVSSVTINLRQGFFHLMVIPVHKMSWCATVEKGQRG